MYEIVYLFFIAIVLYFDLKSRIIPDVVNFFFMFLAIALTILQYEFNMRFLIFGYMPFFIANFLFAYVLYKIGVWAGGDVKFFTALMAYLPLYLPASGYPSLFSAFSVFLLSAFLLVPIALLYNIEEIIGRRREFKKVFVNSIIGAGKSTALSFTVLLVISRFSQIYSSPLLIASLLILSFLIKIPLKIALPIMLAGLLFFRLNDYLWLLQLLFFASFILQFLRGAFIIVSKRILTKEVPIGKLREGMIPAQTYYFEGKRLRVWSSDDAFREIERLLTLGRRVAPYRLLHELSPKGRVVVDSLKARGLLPSEIKELKRLRVKGILVKESLPFAPVIAAAFLLHGHVGLLKLLGL